MDQENVVVNSDMVYPSLFIPKKNSIFVNVTDYDNMFINLNISARDTEDKELRIYSGLCKMIYVDSCIFKINQAESARNSKEMPILSEANHMSSPSYNQSQEPIDLSRTPFVNNQYNASSQKQYAIHEAGGSITKKQHNTELHTQNGSNYKESNVFNFKDHQQSLSQPKISKQQNSNEHELKCGDFQSQLKKQNKARKEVDDDIVIIIDDSPSTPQKKMKYKCDKCKQTFDQRSALRQHTVCDHSNDIIKHEKHARKNKTGQTETLTEIDKDKAEGKHAKLQVYKCNFCDKSFYSSRLFSIHKKIDGHSYSQCDLSQRNFNKKKMDTHHMEQNKTKPLKCTYCNSTFHYEAMLKRHIKSAHQKDTNVNFKCKICGDGFKSSKDILDHKWMIHYRRKMSAKCSICPAKFKKYSELRRHSLGLHEMDVPTARKLLRKKV